MEICFICNEKISKENYHGLSNHLRIHNIKKEEYLNKYVYSTDYMLCKCGCGNKTSKKRLWPYKSDYVIGHNSKGNLNPRFGVKVSNDTKNKMSQSAKIRMAKQLKETGYLPYHSPESIEKRGKLQTDKYIAMIQAKCNITVLEIYKRSVGYYLVKCNHCNHEFNSWHGNSILCPLCHPSPKSSLEEKLYADLSKLGELEIIRNSRSVLPDGLELDFYIPAHKLAIEIHGLYYHGELHGKTSKYHLEKMNECNKLGIELIQVFEDEFISKYDVVLEKIKRAIKHSTQHKLGARKCIVKTMSATQTRQFLEEYHLQGSDNSPIRLGLFYKDELVAIMTFTKPNASRGKLKTSKIIYELSRYCVHKDYSISGGFTKLLEHFKHNYNTDTIVSYADLRWVSKKSNIYKSSGFTLIHQSKPNYWYFRGQTRYHRFNFTKQKTISLGGSSIKTEWENMITLGYDRVWDCGNLRYELNL